MRPTTFLATAALLVTASMAANIAHAQWTRDGASPCGDPSCLGYPTSIVSDGAGGAVFGKLQLVHSGAPAYYYIENLQRVTADGFRSAGWAEQGAYLGLKITSQMTTVLRGQLGGFLYLSLSFDPADPTGNLSRLYAYHVNDSGGFPAGWDSSGVLISSASLPAGGDVSGCSDAAGGYYVAWDQESATGSDVLLTHLDANGQLVSGWPAGGLRLDRGLSNGGPFVFADGLGGVVVVAESGDGSALVYAYRVHADGTLAWPAFPTGAPLGTHPFPAAFSNAVSDGQGGAYAIENVFASMDQSDLYLEHIGADGNLTAGWPANGVRMTSVQSLKGGVIAVTDGGSGVYLGWQEQGPRYGYFLQHMTSSGARAAGWPSNGMPPATGPNLVDGGAIAPDGAGGLYCVLQEPNVSRVLLQHQTASGVAAPGWPAGGVDACPDVPGATSDENFVQITSDGSGGAIAAWGRGTIFSGLVQLNRLGPVGVVATELALVSTQATPQAVTLQWFSGAAHGETYQLQRMPQGSEWANLAMLTPDGAGQLSYDDHSIIAGQRYGYRLMTIGAGAHVAGPETWVSVPAAYRFALAGARPSPAPRSNISVAFSLEPNLPASLELYDLSGRRVLLRDVGALGAGDHMIHLGADERPAAGMYWLRLTQGARRATARVVIAE